MARFEDLRQYRVPSKAILVKLDCGSLKTIEETPSVLGVLEYIVVGGCYDVWEIQSFTH